jgi:hypothetical protein
VERADVPDERAVAVAIAEGFLDALAAGTCQELTRYLARPVEQLIMGADQRPYLVTAVAVRRAVGSLYLHVGVTNAEWDTGVPVVRSAVVTFRNS